MSVDVSYTYRKRLENAFQNDVDVSEMYEILKLDELKNKLATYLDVDEKTIDISVFKDPELERNISPFDWHSKYGIRIERPHYLGKVLYTDGIFGSIQSYNSYIGKYDLHNIAVVHLKFISPLYKLNLDNKYCQCASIDFNVFKDEDFHWNVDMCYKFKTKQIDNVTVHEFIRE